MINVYINADFVSFDEHSQTYSVMVESHGKIAYMGYNIPMCYDDERIIDLEQKSVVPAINSVIPIDAPGASCDCLSEGNYADFAVLDRNIIKCGNANVEKVFVHGRDLAKKPKLPFIIKR